MGKKTNAIRPADVAPLLGLTAQAVRVQMQNGKLPIGVITKGKHGGSSYVIFPDKLYNATGIKYGGYEPEISNGLNYKLLAVAIVDELAKRFKAID